MEFGKMFKLERQIREISRESAAKSLGIDEETLILIEDDLISPPLRLAEDMAAFFSMSIEELLGEEDYEEDYEEECE